MTFLGWTPVLSKSPADGYAEDQPVSDVVDAAVLVVPEALRQVVAYDDAPGIPLAVDVLECGHKVGCSRKPGGRKVVGHQERCPTCSTVADAEMASQGSSL